jgi:hypothetical protein
VLHERSSTDAVSTFPESKTLLAHAWLMLESKTLLAHAWLMLESKTLLAHAWPMLSFNFLWKEARANDSN